MSNNKNEPMDGIFETSTNDATQPERARPARPPKPKSSLGRETKVGLAVIVALLVIFVVVLIIRLKGPDEAEVADDSSSAAKAPVTNQPAATEKRSNVQSAPTVLSATSDPFKSRYKDDGPTSSQTGSNLFGYGDAGDNNDKQGAGEPFSSRRTEADVSATAAAGEGASQETKGADPIPAAAESTVRLNSGTTPDFTTGDAQRGSTADAALTDPFAARGNNTNAGGTGSAYGDASGSFGAAATDKDALDQGSPEASANTGRADEPSKFEFPANDTLQPTTNSASTSLVKEAVPQPKSQQQAKSLASNDRDDQSEAPAFFETQPASSSEIGSARNATANQTVKSRTDADKLAPANELKFGSPKDPNRAPAKFDASIAVGTRPVRPLSDTSSAMAPIAETYTVRADDTYWTIAEQTYGSGAYFKAIYEHNRRQNRTADRLQAGTRLSLPDEATLQRLYPTLCPKTRKVPPAAAIQASASVRVNGPMYVVEQGDTLYEIARRKLGKSSRWAEIVELNRDTLGDEVQPLEPGTRLVLPSGDNARITRPASSNDGTRTR